MKLFSGLFIAMAATAGAWAAPANDAFSNRPNILATGVGTPFATTGTLAASTVEPGEPAHAGHPRARSVWWTWTAPSNGTLELSTAGSVAPTALALYTGTRLPKLTVVAHDVDSGTSGTSLLRATVEIGVTYQIAVADATGAQGAIALRLSHNPANINANDTFADRIPLAGAYTTAWASTQRATKQPGEPAHAGNAGGCSVWWSWTAPSSGPVTISTRDSYVPEAGRLDTLLAVYTGTAVNALALVANSDDAPGNRGPHSEVTFDATEGVTYQIAVDGYRDEGGFVSTGFVRLSLQLESTNDRFTSPAVIATPSASIIDASNIGATKESGEPAHSGNAGGKSVWWTWRAPANGTVTLSTEHSGFDTLLAVYTGTQLSALTPIAADDDSGPAGTSRVEFAVVADRQYLIAVDGKDGASGSIWLDLRYVSDLPAIQTQPSSVSTEVGGSATFTVVATGQSPLTYLWQRRATSSSSWVTLAGETTDTLALSDLAQSANNNQFRVQVTNSLGTVTSEAATLSVTPRAPSITEPGTLRVRGAVQIASAPPDAPESLQYYASKLPPGLTIDRATGIISGTPTKAGSYTITYWSQDGKVKSEPRSITLVVLGLPEPMFGSFEGLLLDDTGDAGLPAGKVSLKVTSAGAFSGQLLTADQKAFSLKGTLNLNETHSAGSATLTLKRAKLESYTLDLAVSATGVLSAELRELAVVKGATDSGVPLAVHTAASPAPGVGNYTAAFDAERLDSGDTRPIPGGAGYATGSIAKTGNLKLTGKLPDGTPWTVSTPLGADSAYRVYVKPHKTEGNYLGGRLPLSIREDAPALRHIVTEDLYWTKPASASEKFYPAGFGPLGLAFRMEPWTKPASLGQTFGLPLSGANHLFALGVAAPDISNAEPNPRGLPTELAFTSKNAVLAPANSVKWTTKVNAGTGVFTGSFSVTDQHPTTGKTVTRKITIEGVLLQLPAGSGETGFGRGFVLAPPVVKGDPSLAGRVTFSPPLSPP